MTKRSFTSETLGVLGTNFSVLILSILGSIAVSRTLGPEAKGVFTSILVVPLTIKGFCELGLRQSTMYYLGKEIFDEIKYIRSVFGLYLITTSVSLALTAYIYFLLDNPAYTISNISLALLTLPINLLLTYSGGVFLGKDLITKFNRQKWIPAVFNLLGIIIFVWLMKLGIWGALLTTVLSSAIILIFNMHYIITKYGRFKPLFDFKIIGSILKLGAIYGLSLFIIQLNYRINILLLERFSSAAEIGYFSVGTAIAELLWQMPAALGIIIISKSATTSRQDKLEENTLQLLRLALLAGIGLAIAIYITTPYLLPLFYGHAYIPSIHVVQAILPGVLIMIVFKILNSRLAGLGKPYYALYAFAPTLVLNSILGYFFIPQYHAVGAAMISNICWTISVVILVFLYSSKMNVPLRKIFAYQITDFNFVSRLRKTER
jgi:O-antigen/teichoic acid export membrane protein